VSLLVVAGGAQAGGGPETSSLQDIYSALRVENVVPANGSTEFAAGSQVYFSFDLVNTSSKTLVVPLKQDHGLNLRFVGVAQTWIERLGPDPTIPGGIAFHHGNLYGEGGWLWAIDGTNPDGVIPPGGTVPSQSLLDTTGLPPGQYRYWVSYEPLSTGGIQWINSATVDITID